MSRIGVSDGLREGKVMDISCLKEAQVGNPNRYEFVRGMWEHHL